MLAPLEHYRYLTTARRRLFEAVRCLSPEQYVREFPFGLHTVRRTLHHMAGAEWFMLGQLHHPRGGLEPSRRDHGHHPQPATIPNPDDRHQNVYPVLLS
ncbi:MAG: DinB family protein [bacterium]